MNTKAGQQTSMRCWTHRRRHLSHPFWFLLNAIYAVSSAKAPLKLKSLSFQYLPIEVVVLFIYAWPAILDRFVAYTINTLTPF
jgi:hypothetical protein